MKKKILLWIACIVMGLAVAACAAPEPEESAETENTGEDKGEGASGKFEGDAKDYKVALLIPGSLGDKSFFLRSGGFIGKRIWHESGLCGMRY